MHVKGTAVKSLQDYVKKYHDARYSELISAMPESSKSIMNKSVFVSDWYPIKEAAVEPTKAIGKLFFDGDEIKAAWETGRYSAEVALGGVYKIFVKMATPKFIIERASKILPAYYDPSEVIVKESSEKHVTISIPQIPISDAVLEARIAGWIQKAMEVTGCKNVKIDIALSHTRGDSATEMRIFWD